MAARGGALRRLRQASTWIVHALRGEWLRGAVRFGGCDRRRPESSTRSGESGSAGCCASAAAAGVDLNRLRAPGGTAARGGALRRLRQASTWIVYALRGEWLRGVLRFGGCDRRRPESSTRSGGKGRGRWRAAAVAADREGRGGALRERLAAGSGRGRSAGRRRGAAAAARPGAFRSAPARPAPTAR
ncbi:hypothetical protein GALL_302420 [mine drainage metagenome]|uniref:Uncharacterized protein n=1 Tax=mine drainage metagenome TaxID=410659 RepID=A0A1J5QW31_9ZZZZ